MTAHYCTIHRYDAGDWADVSMPYNEAIADQVHTFARHARNQDV